MADDPKITVANEFKPLPIVDAAGNAVGAHDAWANRMSRTQRVTEGIKANYEHGTLLGNGLRLGGAAIGSALVIDGVSKGVKVFTGSPVGKDENGNPIPADWGHGLKAAAEILSGGALTVGSLAIGGRRNFMHGRL